MLNDLFKDYAVDDIDADKITGDIFKSYDNLILGVPTVFYGELPIYWDEFVPELLELDLTGKKIAVFGNGDQRHYPDNFVDAIGIMTDIAESRGAAIAGCVSTDGYFFDKSRAVKNNMFRGLPIDAENQQEMTEERLQKWAGQLINELELKVS
jgi:flavodoxin I